MKSTVNYIKGAHNALTAARPLHWWGWLTVPFARCQSKGIGELITAGVRCFDIRVRYDRHHGCWRGCHGLLTTRADAMEAIGLIAHAAGQSSEKYLVRIVHETGKADYTADMRFGRLCRRLVERFGGNVTFFEGRRKGGWALLHDFGVNPAVWQPVSSMAADARWWERICPWLYARRHNAAGIRDAPDGTEIALMDFI